MPSLSPFAITGSSGPPPTPPTPSLAWTLPWRRPGSFGPVPPPMPANILIDFTMTADLDVQAPTPDWTMTRDM